MKYYFLLFLFGLFLGFLIIFMSQVKASSDKHENAECIVNNSDHRCALGFVCVPFNANSGNGKCEIPTPTLTVTPTAGDSATETPTDTQDIPATNAGGTLGSDNRSDGRSDGLCSRPPCHNGGMIIPAKAPGTGKGL